MHISLQTFIYFHLKKVQLAEAPATNTPFIKAKLLPVELSGFGSFYTPLDKATENRLWTCFENSCYKHLENTNFKGQAESLKISSLEKF